MAKVSRQRVKKRAAKKAIRKSSSSSFLQGIEAIQEPDVGIKMALYGKSGSGKTTFACSFPKKLLLVRVGVDDGVRSVFNVKGVETTPLVSRADDLDEVIEEQRRNNRWKTIVLDTASELQNVILAEVVGLESAPTQLSWGVAKREQWGDTAFGMKNKLRDLMALADQGTHIVIVAQERNFGDENESDILMPSVGEALTPSVAGWLNPACDYICQTFIRAEVKTVVKKLKTKTVKREVRTGEYEYCLRTGVHDVYITKFRAPKGFKVPEVIADPDYNKFHSLLNGKGG